MDSETRAALETVRSLIRQLQGRSGFGGQVNGDGSIAVGSGFTVVRTGTGQYTVTFEKPFGSAPTASVNAIGAGALSARFGSVTATVLTVATFTSNTGVVVDAAFAFLVRPL